MATPTLTHFGGAKGKLSVITNSVEKNASLTAPASDPLRWEWPHFVRDEQPQAFSIALDHAPCDGEAAAIFLNAGIKSDLSWDEEIQLAQDHVAAGRQLFWCLDLGLFENLRQPLADEGQFRTLAIALAHFVKVAYQPLADATLGVSLYRGSAAMGAQLSMEGYDAWRQEQEAIDSTLSQTLYRRDVCADYLDLLAGELPVELEAFALLDGTSAATAAEEALLCARNTFRRVLPTVRSTRLRHDGLKWNEGSLEVSVEFPPAYGVLLPERIIDLHKLDSVFSSLQQSVRLVSEPLLVAEWAGLDVLFVDPAGLGAQGLRKLHGFCAAGGTVVTVGEPLGVSREMGFNPTLTASAYCVSD